MTHDPKLVELPDGWSARFVANNVEICGPDADLDVITMPLSALLILATAAIDAAVDERGNRIAWVAPWHASESMILAGREWRADPWPFMRDTCLAERRGEWR